MIVTVTIRKDSGESSVFEPELYRAASGPPSNDGGPLWGVRKMLC